MALATSYPTRHVLIVQDDDADVSDFNNAGFAKLVGIIPLVDGTIAVWFEDDNTTDFPNGLLYPVIAGVPLIGRIKRIFATGTTLSNAEMAGLRIDRD